MNRFDKSVNIVWHVIIYESVVTFSVYVKQILRLTVYDVM